jgi:hypothetical protein
MFSLIKCHGLAMLWSSKDNALLQREYSKERRESRYKEVFIYFVRNH